MMRLPPVWPFPGRRISDNRFATAVKLQSIPVSFCAVDSSEENYLKDCLEKGICPFCKQVLPENGSLGTGQQRKGKFCNLTCYTTYYERELRERLGKGPSGESRNE